MSRLTYVGECGEVWWLWYDLSVLKILKSL